MALVIRNRTEPAPLRSSPASLDSEDATAVDHPQASAFAEPRRRGKTQEGLHRDRHIRRGWLVRRMLLAADLAGLLAAFFATELIFLGNRLVDNVGIGEETLIFVVLLPAWIVAAKLYGLYDRDEERATHSTADEVMSVFHLITVGVWLFFATSWLAGLWRPDQAKLATFWLLALLAVVTARSAARALARRHRAYVQNTVVVGAGDVGQLIGRKLLQHPEYGINLLGFVDAAPKEMRRDLADVRSPGIGTSRRSSSSVLCDITTFRSTLYPGCSKP